MRRVYRTLLRLYPREYRRQFGDEMLAVFTRAAAERRVEGQNLVRGLPRCRVRRVA